MKVVSIKIINQKQQKQIFLFEFLCLLNLQRIGGWRKLWFVLQNQLLLSYSSREDYEKKLVPFKDVLNLVPGSVVRPASGSRFTIETPSNTMYTFVSFIFHLQKKTI